MVLGMVGSPVKPVQLRNALTPIEVTEYFLPPYSIDAGITIFPLLLLVYGAPGDSGS